MTDGSIAAAVLVSLDAGERDGAVVYVDETFVDAGGTLRVDGQDTDVPAGTVVAFVDLEPGVNWGHPCRYVFIDAETRSMRTRGAQFPPFLTADVPGMHAVHVGASAPAWAVWESGPS
jgi:hypothetical protein